MEKNKRIYGHRKKQAQYFKDLIKQKTHITSTGQATAACTSPQQLNHKAKDSEHDSSLWKWPFLVREARLGNTSMLKKTACFAHEATAEIWQAQRFWQDCEPDDFEWWFRTKVPKTQQPGCIYTTARTLPSLSLRFLWEVENTTARMSPNTVMKNFIWLGKNEPAQLLV